MKANIAVVGMGQGGMTAAIKLAQAGANVTIYEKKEEGFVSYDWTDDIKCEVFKIANLPFPDEDVYAQKADWLFVSPNNKGELVVPSRGNCKDLSVYRRKFSEYFIKQAKEAGATCVFGEEISKLVVENDRVVGIETKDGIKKYDLVIDASGLMSKLRGQVPAKFNVQASPKKTDTLWGYRAFFKRNEDVPLRREGYDCTLTFKQLGGEGISWCNVSPDGKVDVLICRMQELKKEDIDLMFNDFKERYKMIGDEKLSETVVPLGLRAGIACPVADGYVALGDSAFMIIPVMGSGIEASMQGGAWFAEHVINNNVEDFTAKNMWGFYVKYMKKLGAGFSLLDVVRRWGLRLPAKRVDWLLSSGFLKDNDMLWLLVEKGDPRKAKFKLGYLLAKPFYLLAHPIFTCNLLGMAGKAIGSLLLTLRIPKKYKEKKVAKWANKYNGRVDKIEAKALKKQQKSAK